MRRLLPALFLLLLGLLSSGASPAAEPAPDFALRDLSNKEVRLSDLRGKVVLISFWATWCGPCMTEMPHLEALHQELADDGLVVLAISADDARSASKVKPLIRSKGYTFTVLLDRTSEVIAQYNPQKTLPYTVLIDRSGRIAWRHAGYVAGDEKELAERVRALLSGS